MESEAKPEKKIITPTDSVPSDLFLEVKEILPYKCEICQNIPYYEDAIETICCGHLYCSACLKEKTSLGGNCPFCKTTYKTNQHSKFISKILSEFKISCPMRGRCKWQGKWKDLSNHIEECEESFRYCNYRKFGCEFSGTFKECKEHEEKEMEKHFNQVLEFNERNVIKNDLQIRFDYGMCYKVSIHEHPLSFKESSTWTCNGVKQKGGCMSPRPNFKTTYRFRCEDCDFDLCPYCMMKYATERVSGDNDD